MENRYLFKAKRLDNAEWVIGNLVFSVYHKNDVCVGQYGNEVGMHEVDSSTICQCTGLKDKNGNLIWENDIVNAVASNSVGEPICVNGIVVKVTDYNLMLNLYYSDELECVGNIFDNKELLESEG